MQLRRTFVEGMSAGLLGAVMQPARVLGANDRIRLGIIGPGAQGQALLRAAMSCPNTEIVAAADVYTRRLEEVKQLAPGVDTYLDYRRVLDDKSIDAVLIATPQHLHCRHFVASLDAGKHVYQEKTMAFTVAHAKRMRAVYQRAGRRTVQIGNQGCSQGQIADASEFVAGGNLGKITAIHAHMYRNTAHGKPQWARPILADMIEKNIDWKAFQGEAAPHAFDANRYMNWRFFWDYSGGNFYENMCHQLAFWYKVLELRIPAAVTAVGGIYLWKDGREVPDTMNVAMQHSEDLLFTWDSGFGNDELGVTEHVLGTDGTVVGAYAMRKPVRYIPQKVNSPDRTALVGKADGPKWPLLPHMQNFLDCIRSGKEPNAPFELGFRTSITARMTVESYRQGRTVRWDPVKEEIV